MPQIRLDTGYVLDIPDNLDDNLAWSMIQDELVITFSKPGSIAAHRLEGLIKIAGSDSVTTMMGMSVGAVSMTSTQRKAIADITKDKLLISVLEAAPITRGIVTALGWFGLNIKSYGWKDLSEAVHDSVPDGAKPEEVLEVCNLLRQHLYSDSAQ